MNRELLGLTVIIPAAGVGSRMQIELPKQYVEILDKTVLEHTVNKFLDHPQIDRIIVAIAPNDPYFHHLPIAHHPNVISVIGGEDRANSVLAGLNYAAEHFRSTWVLVHDAARPCVRHQDIDNLINGCIEHPIGGILAYPSKDTVKYVAKNIIKSTLDRTNLWHASTPQMFKTELLKYALTDAINNGDIVTDEASALERLQQEPLIIQGRSDNIKITNIEDLSLAHFYLSKQNLD